MNYFISDTHFRHANIIHYCNRPFKTIAEMDTTIINNINKVVKEDDILWHLGDFAYGRNADEDSIVFLRNQIVCKNIILIIGNHDKIILKSKRLSNLFKQILNYYLGRIDNWKFLLIHKPPDKDYPSWEETLINKNMSYLWLHGHTHNNNHLGPRNLCVENNNYSPISLENVLKRF
jgi:calcineurin-like phosphoesterase family protein